jgi:hypothetical protein
MGASSSTIRMRVLLSLSVKEWFLPPKGGFIIIHYPGKVNMQAASPGAEKCCMSIIW